jgi:hypothetical protein
MNKIALVADFVDMPVSRQKKKNHESQVYKKKICMWQRARAARGVAGRQKRRPDVPCFVLHFGDIML